LHTHDSPLQHGTFLAEVVSYKYLPIKSAVEIGPEPRLGTERFACIASSVAAKKSQSMIYMKDTNDEGMTYLLTGFTGRGKVAKPDMSMEVLAIHTDSLPTMTVYLLARPCGLWVGCGYKVDAVLKRMLLVAAMVEVRRACG